MPCIFSVLQARSLVFFFNHFLVSQVRSILNLVRFLIFHFWPGWPGGRSIEPKWKPKKRLKTRRKRPSFRNGLGTVLGVYEATTIAHRTPQPLRSQQWAVLLGCPKLHFGVISLLPSLLLRYRLAVGRHFVSNVTPSLVGPRVPCSSLEMGLCIPAGRG